MPYLQLTQLTVKLNPNSRRRIQITIIKPLQIEPQVALTQTQASQAYRNWHQFTKLNHSKLSITKKSQISSIINTKKSHTLNNSRAQLVNNKKSLFAQSQSEIQLSSSYSINLIESSTISIK